jgi:glutathione S-transferase
MGMENRQGTYLARNPGGQIPALELDDGTVLGETVAIFEYLEETHPTPALIGTTAAERAAARMWQRRVELKITEHLYNGFRFAEGIELFRPRLRVLPEAADGLKATAQDGLAWLDPLLAGKDWIAGDRFTMADIILYCALDFGRGVGQSVPPELVTVSHWFDRVGARPAAGRSLHPQAEAVGMNG